MRERQHGARAPPLGAPRTGFAGRAPLISGVMRKAEPSAELGASTILLNTVMQVAGAAPAREKYQARLLELSRGIVQTRLLDEVLEMADELTQSQEKPATKREALEIALRQKGFTAEIISEQEASTFTFFKIMINGAERYVPLPHSIMEGDALANVGKALGTMGIVGSSEELMGYAQKERDATRPPGEIDIDPELLRRRRISYDGRIVKSLQFTYYVSGVNSSIMVDGSLRNGELLAEIDSRIDQLHRAYNKPFDSSVVEQQASEMSCYRVEHDSELERVVNALHALADSSEEALLPREYVNAVRILRKSDEFIDFKALPVMTDIATGFVEAYQRLDDPSYALLRSMHPHYCDNEGNLTDEGIAIAISTLGMGKTEKTGLEEAALRNIAAAYAFITGIQTREWTEENMRNEHLRMMVTIRRRMSELTSNVLKAA
jgi:hypothetical protein